jgi:hypothetical protein
MTAERNKEIALSLIEALNARDLTLWSRHLSENYAAEHPGVAVELEKRIRASGSSAPSSMSPC